MITRSILRNKAVSSSKPTSKQKNLESSTKNANILKDSSTNSSEISKSEFQVGNIPTPDIVCDIEDVVKNEFELSKLSESENLEHKSEKRKRKKDVKLEVDQKQPKVETSNKRRDSVNDWKVTFEKIREFRLLQINSLDGMKPAPVDIYGCEALASHSSTTSLETKKFISLVSLMLSSQTRDEMTATAVNNLIKNLKCETVKDIKPSLGVNEDGLTYDGKVPENLSQLVKISGVGPKMGILAIQTFQSLETSKDITPVGIGVDTHVFRISKLLGWANKDTKTPEDVRKQLEKLFPKTRTYWCEVNKLLVGLGQTVCVAKSPKCDICPVNQLCISSKVKSKLH
ncbi:hypothetical protein BB559_001389 [Furculomyces boomerangus]|uniref:HhH-GPD domain-containing protein n=1 Tax=Furculomyces boomerangus TaxID=61424 RepID=A0A2T9Z224_9FUNG|nr:hypothetical protein BB559_001389 [Furculomyces boomerangus]